MHVSIRRASVFAVLLLVAFASAAYAAKPTSGFVPVPVGATLQHVSPAGGTAVTSACQPGETRPVLGYLPYVVPPDDRYFSLISPSQCTVCGPAGAIEITVGHMGVYFPQICTATIAVSVVGATPSPANPSCLVPDESNVICPPTIYTVSVPAAGGYDIQLPLPAGCCITKDAFLSYNFLGTDCQNQLGIFATVAPCNPCQSWNFYPVGAGTAMDDLCNVFSYYSAGNLWMWADAECCQPVPVPNKTWGRIKTLYR